MLCSNVEMIIQTPFRAVAFVPLSDELCLTHNVLRGRENEFTLLKGNYQGRLDFGENVGYRSRPYAKRLFFATTFGCVCDFTSLVNRFGDGNLSDQIILKVNGKQIRSQSDFTLEQMASYIRTGQYVVADKIKEYLSLTGKKMYYFDRINYDGLHISIPKIDHTDSRVLEEDGAYLNILFRRDKDGQAFVPQVISKFQAKIEGKPVYGTEDAEYNTCLKQGRLLLVEHKNDQSAEPEKWTFKATFDDFDRSKYQMIVDSYTRSMYGDTQWTNQFR